MGLLLCGMLWSGTSMTLTRAIECLAYQGVYCCVIVSKSNMLNSLILHVLDVVPEDTRKLLHIKCLYLR